MDRPIRLIEILQLLGGRRAWRPEQIAERFGISERTVYRDLQDLSRLESIPITRDEHGYRLVEGATIRWLGLTSTEREPPAFDLDAFLQQTWGVYRGRCCNTAATMHAATRRRTATQPAESVGRARGSEARRRSA